VPCKNIDDASIPGSTLNNILQVATLKVLGR